MGPIRGQRGAGFIEDLLYCRGENVCKIFNCFLGLECANDGGDN
jgi:hypothetical protein